MSNAFGHRFSVLRFRDCGLFVFVARSFLKVLDMWESHSCACTCSAVAILLVVRGCSLKETSCAIPDWVLTWKVPVRLMPIGTILTSAFSVPWVLSSSLNGS